MFLSLNSYFFLIGYWRVKKACFRKCLVKGRVLICLLAISDHTSSQLATGTEPSSSLNKVGWFVSLFVVGERYILTFSR
jgi:hypothetical protein